MIDEAVAGSWPKRRNSIGTSAPARPAATIAMTIEMEITSTSPTEPLQIYTPTAVVAATARPLMRPVAASLPTTAGQ